MNQHCVIAFYSAQVACHLTVCLLLPLAFRIRGRQLSTSRRSIGREVRQEYVGSVRAVVQIIEGEEFIDIELLHH